MAHLRPENAHPTAKQRPKPRKGHHPSSGESGKWEVPGRFGPAQEEREKLSALGGSGQDNIKVIKGAGQRDPIPLPRPQLPKKDDPAPQSSGEDNEKVVKGS